MDCVYTGTPLIIPLSKDKWYSKYKLKNSAKLTIVRNPMANTRNAANFIA
ncbi:hypothetical protein J4447_05150 [Candidatus Pacearchaeota archaeon]|nr:hypothetical protein [Candidatus Pacearchaeota archaeon]